MDALDEVYPPYRHCGFDFHLTLCVICGRSPAIRLPPAVESPYVTAARLQSNGR
jgi:hypothetical protein